jgi:hypothetical protein
MWPTFRHLMNYSGGHNPGVMINLTVCKMWSTWHTKKEPRGQVDLAVQVAVLFTERDKHGSKW